MSSRRSEALTAALAAASGAVLFGAGVVLGTVVGGKVASQP